MQVQGHFFTFLNDKCGSTSMLQAQWDSHLCLTQLSFRLVLLTYSINKHNLSSSLMPGLRCVWCQALWQQKHHDLKAVISIKQL